MKKHIARLLTIVFVIVAFTAHFAPTARAEEHAEPAIVEVADYVAFAQAVIQANDGDIISVTGNIIFPASIYFGDAKRLTIQRGTPDGRITTDYVDGTPDSEFRGFTFDGANIPSDYAFVSVSQNAVFDDVAFINCVSNSSAVAVINGAVTFSNCRFQDNSGVNGGHLRITGNTTVSITDCLFTGGYAQMTGGAIHNSSVCSITSSVITDNQAADVGGGIASTGQMTITDSKIYGNKARSGADIANSIWGSLTLNDGIEKLISMFEGDGLVPVGWVYDYSTTPITDSVTLDQMNNPQYVPLKLAFEDNTTPTPPTEQPPTIVYVPYPVYVTPEPTTPETPNEFTPRLVCGDAVLDHTRRDYWTGYVSSFAGQQTPITRLQAVRTLYQLLTPESLEQIYSNADVFTDAPNMPFISTLANAGVVHGCGNGQFQPERSLTWGEMIALFTRFVEPRTDQRVQFEHWSSGAIQTAVSYGWLDYGDGFNPDSAVSGQEFSDFALIVLEWANGA